MAERKSADDDDLDETDAGEREPKPQVRQDPARRRPRFIHKAPSVVVAALIVAAAVVTGWAAYWALGLPAIASRGGLVAHPAFRVAGAVLAAVVVAWLVAWLCRPAQTIRRGVRTWFTSTRRRTMRLPLFASVLVAALVGLAVAAWATGSLGGDIFGASARGANFETFKAALPAIAGIVVAIALVVAFRRQRDSERARSTHRFGAASVQLGDADAAVRIAGVYAMAAVADESSIITRRQQAIDVLCGYLRLPYDPEAGSNHLSEFVTTTTWSATPPATNIEEQRRQLIRQNDREVRQTIVRVIARHLQDGADSSWSGNDLDFTGVLFEDASFAGARFGGRRTSFDGATFTGATADFDDAEFNAEHVSFEEAVFTADTASFVGATFRSRLTSFDGARFTGSATEFDEARFSGEHVTFREIDFGAVMTSFRGAKFKCLHAAFDAPTGWDDVLFDWDSSGGEDGPRVPRTITPREWPPLPTDVRYESASARPREDADGGSVG